MKTKICTICHREKIIVDFRKCGPSERSKDGYRNQCKQCIYARRPPATVEQKRNKSKYDKYRIAKIKKMPKPKLSKKFCSKCKQILNITKFTKDCTRFDGYHPWCKECTKKNRNDNFRFEYNKKYRTNLPDAYIRSILSAHTHLKAQDIPNELIDIGRLYIQIKRKLREERCKILKNYEKNYVKFFKN